ncbi:MAG: hypothetical protein IKJ19_00600 [Clostridia bacterium]|nr:hypothetical protein [Clostridia bacterium]
MKKIVALVLAILSLLCFASCGNASKLNDMEQFGEESTHSQAKTWANNLMIREHPVQDNWYNLKANVQLKTQERGISTEVDYSIKTTFLKCSDLKDFTGKMYVDFEYKESYEMNGEAQSNLMHVKMDIICVDQWLYAEVDNEITIKFNGEIENINENYKVKSQIVYAEVLQSVDSMLEILSLQYFQSIVNSNLGENAKYYLGDNYLGISFEDEGNLNSIYYQFEENTSVISEVGYKETYANGDLSNQLIFKKCSPISVKVPKDADSYEVGELPDLGALA